MKKILVLTLISLSFPAHADNTNQVEFTNTGSLTAATLGGIIADSHVNFQPGSVDESNYHGNVVQTGAFDHTFGVAAVNQNTGINANAQQAISVTIGSLNLNSVSN